MAARQNTFKWPGCAKRKRKRRRNNKFSFGLTESTGILVWRKVSISHKTDSCLLLKRLILRWSFVARAPLGKHKAIRCCWNCQLPLRQQPVIGCWKGCRPLNTAARYSQRVVKSTGAILLFISVSILCCWCLLVSRKKEKKTWKPLEQKVSVAINLLKIYLEIHVNYCLYCDFKAAKCTRLVVAMTKLWSRRKSMAKLRGSQRGQRVAAWPEGRLSYI